MKKSDIILAIIVLLLYALIATNTVNSASIQGLSMYPVFQNGQLTFYIPTHNADIGDIIIYYSPNRGTYVIHQVVQIYGNGDSKSYVTKGINPITNPLPDNSPSVQLEPSTGIPQKYVIGVVVNINKVSISIPYVGYLSLLFSTLI
jgi:signal peptidase